MSARMIQKEAAATMKKSANFPMNMAMETIIEIIHEIPA